jgi:hypothetical protein
MLKSDSLVKGRNGVQSSSSSMGSEWVGVAMLFLLLLRLHEHFDGAIVEVG